MDSETDASPTSSFQALESDPGLSILAKKMFQNVQNYLEMELQNNAADFQLLSSMNQTTTAKYSDMKSQCDQVVIANSELTQKYEDLTPVLEQIDEIEKTVQKLESAAYRLNAYSLKLEEKINQKLQKMKNS